MQAARKLESFESYESYRYHEAIQKEKKKLNEMLRKDERPPGQEGNQVPSNAPVLLLVFASLAAMIYQYSALYEQQYVVNGLKSDISQMTMDIEEVKSTLDSTVSLDNVERVAMTELNMQYPKPEQIVYIKSNWHYALDKPSQNKYLGKEENTKSENLSGHVYDYIMKFALGDKTNPKTVR